MGQDETSSIMDSVAQGMADARPSRGAAERWRFPRGKIRPLHPATRVPRGHGTAPHWTQFAYGRWTAHWSQRGPLPPPNPAARPGPLLLHPCGGGAPIRLGTLRLEVRALDDHESAKPRGSRARHGTTSCGSLGGRRTPAVRTPVNLRWTASPVFQANDNSSRSSNAEAAAPHATGMMTNTSLPKTHAPTCSWIWRHWPPDGSRRVTRPRSASQILGSWLS